MRFRVPEWAAVLFFVLMCLLVVGYALRCAYAFTCARHAQSDGREHDVYIKEEWSGGKKTEVMMGHFGVSLFSFSPSGWEGRKSDPDLAKYTSPYFRIGVSVARFVRIAFEKQTFDCTPS